MNYTLSKIDGADETVWKAILGPLVQYNKSKVESTDRQLSTVVIRNSDKQIVGGIWASTDYGWLFTELVVVPENLRNQGIGSKMLSMVEQEAVARGCHGAWLDTFEFQARTFYEKRGYELFGELADYPTGYTRYFMKKALV